MESALSLTITEYFAKGTGKPTLPEESLGRVEQLAYVNSELHSPISAGSFHSLFLSPFALSWLSVVSEVSGSKTVFRQTHFQLSWR